MNSSSSGDRHVVAVGDGKSKYAIRAGFARAAMVACGIALTGGGCSSAASNQPAPRVDIPHRDSRSAVAFARAFGRGVEGGTQWADHLALVPTQPVSAQSLDGAAASTLGSAETGQALRAMGARQAAVIQMKTLITDGAADNTDGLVGIKVLQFRSARQAAAFGSRLASGRSKPQDLPHVPGGRLWTFDGTDCSDASCGAIFAFAVGDLFVDGITQGSSKSRYVTLAEQLAEAADGALRS